MKLYLRVALSVRELEARFSIGESLSSCIEGFPISALSAPAHDRCSAKTASPSAEAAAAGDRESCSNCAMQRPNLESAV